MRCERCHQNIARLRVTITTKDGPRTAHLCPACALTLPAFYTPNREIVRTDRACPNCGMRLSEVSATGKLGCSACYDTFALDLADVLMRVQGTDRHIARPQQDTSAGHMEQHSEKEAAGLSESEREIRHLKEELKQAVSGEDYLRAATLRDQIREKEGA